MFFKIVSRHKASSNQKLVLNGQRVFLRAPSLDDYPEWAFLRQSNQEFLTPYEPQWASDSLEKTAYLRRLQRQKEEVQAGRGLFFLIFDKQTNEMLGGINMNDIRYSIQQCATLGYWLAEAQQGRGLMTDAVEIVIDYAFQTLRLNRLNASCLPDNQRSVNLLNKLGFTEEGYAPRYLKINNQWQDHRLFGLCRNT
jgi:ribosomal-protein-alanine N-acetyltransferase